MEISHSTAIFAVSMVVILAVFAWWCVTAIARAKTQRDAAIAATEALRASEQRFREIAEHIQEAFFVVDLTSDRTLYLSPNWSVIWGRPQEDGYKRDIWFQAIHPDDQAGVTAAFIRVRKGLSNERVFRVIRPDRSVRWVHARSFPVKDQEGRISRLVGVINDITDLRLAEERFTHAQKMDAMGRLAGGVAHDFNNLLTVIIGDVDLLRLEFPRSGEDTDTLRDIRRAADSAATLTRQLLAFSRRQLVEPTEFEINTAVLETTKMLRRLIGENIHLETRLAADAGIVRMDRGQLEQVLTNLAVNARDAMPNGGRLVIGISRLTVNPEKPALCPEMSAGDYVLLEVGDTGTGMSNDVVARLFEPFFTTKERGQGTGLGLATVHGIVKQAGGHITVCSEPGIGTNFRLYFPRVIDAAEELHHTMDTMELPRGHETILLVEDEELVRRVTSRILRDLGYTVLEAKDGLEALAIFKSRTKQTDLLFTDVVLPGIQGRALAEQIKKEAPDIRVLFTTGYSDDIILQHQLLERDVRVLQKPYSRDLLAVKVREVLDRG